MGFLSSLLKTISGNTGMKLSEQLLFDKVIGFRGIVPGVGTSTIVQNVAIALAAQTNYSICVLDTHYLYPTLYPMLMEGSDSKRKDYLEFDGDLSEVVLPTAFKNISLASLYNRTLVDMLSTRDSELTVDKLMGSLKSYFDIILVDLSYEPTNLYAYTAIKCNRVINVADYSLKCIYNLRKSLNTMTTLAVPFAKANRVVINKVIPDIVTNVKGVMQEAGLRVIGEIPYSLTVARLGLAGKRIWSNKTADKDIYVFSSVINAIVQDILVVTPLNEGNIKQSSDTYEEEKLGSELVVNDQGPRGSKDKQDDPTSEKSGVLSKLLNRSRKTDVAQPADVSQKSSSEQVEIEDSKSLEDKTETQAGGTSSTKLDEVEVEVPVVHEGSSEVATVNFSKRDGLVEEDFEEEVIDTYKQDN